jgi:hypothetical protein
MDSGLATTPTLILCWTAGVRRRDKSILARGCRSGRAAVCGLTRTVLLATFLALPSIVVAADERSPQTFEDAIAALEKADPGSPEALNDRIEYAGFLIDAVDVDCQQRLDTAQSQLDTVSRTPAADVVLPNGQARVADIQYRVKVARASCGADPAERESDLRDALTSAQRAVDLYRDALDYRSMAIMQFNVAVTQRQSGDHEAAVAALESAVKMDGEYGFRQDAEDNSKVLALWQASDGKAMEQTIRGGANQSADQADPATAPVVTAANVSTRTVSLKFAWSANDATLGVQIDHVGIMNDSVTHGSAYRLFKQHVHGDRDGWAVSYEPGQIAYDVAAWPSEPREVHELAYSFGPALPLPGFEVSAKGDFKRVVNLSGVASDETAAVRKLILGHTSSDAGASRLPVWVTRATKLIFGPAAVEQHAAEDYDFQTGVWIGATLEQGVWYNMSVPLTLPGVRRLQLPHDVEFAYTHDVPCACRSCIEIVVHATPQAESLADLIDYADRKLSGPHKVQVHYWTTTYMRIVTDPNTLTTYVYDTRRYWHASGNSEGSDKPEDHSERLVSTFTYP